MAISTEIEYCVDNPSRGIALVSLTCEVPIGDSRYTNAIQSILAGAATKISSMALTQDGGCDAPGLDFVAAEDIVSAG